MTQGGSSSVTLLKMTRERKTVTDKVKEVKGRGSYANGSTKALHIPGSRTSGTCISNSDGKTNKLQRLQSYQRAVFATLFFGYACYTYNRKCVSYATPTLLAAGLITTNTVGVISSCQNMAYAVSKFLGGVLSDKMSARILFSVGLAVSGTSTLLFSRTENPALWSLLWGLNGFAQGCGWPSCAKLLKKWFSPDNFGTWWSVLTASSNLSGTLSPLLAVYVILTYDWSASLVVAGCLSLGMACVSLVTLVDDPEKVDLPSPATPTPSPAGKTSQGKTKDQEKQGGVRELVSSPFLWVVSACYLAVFMAKTAISEWGQLYLIQELGRSQMEASSFTSAMETGGFFGGILAGVVTDRIASKVRVQANVRLLVAAGFMCLCCGGLYVLAAVLTPASSQVLVSGVGAVLGASMFGPISIYGIVASESFPAHLSGTAHAVVALAANVGAVLAGWPLSRVAKAWSWAGVLVLLQVMAAGSAVLIVASKRVHITRKAKHE